MNIIFSFIIFLMFVSACGISVKTKINAYRLQSVDYNAGICVIGVGNNIALNEELTNKIVKILQSKKNINVVQDCHKADYILAFNYSIKGDKYTYTFYIPMQSRETVYGNIYGDIQGWFSASSTKTEYLPVYGQKVVYYRYILFILVDKRTLKEKQIKPVWQLEISSVGKTGDLRTISDYLLVPLYKYFLKDTKRQIDLIIDEDDPTLKQLKQVLYGSGKQS